MELKVSALLHSPAGAQDYELNLSNALTLAKEYSFIIIISQKWRRQHLQEGSVGYKLHSEAFILFIALAI